jgi:uncharacterized membrane protein YeaQ/YmgE (transglycosylase-associated protein family)
MISVDLLIWLLIGGVAGWLAGVLTKGRGFGCIGNMIIGVIGSVIGGWFFSMTSLAPRGEGLVGIIVTALIGAVAFIIVLRLIFK